MKRRTFNTLLGSAVAAWPLAARAQPAKVVPRIGFLGVTTLKEYSDLVDALHRGFRAVGYEDGKNCVIEYRWAEGKYDRLPALAAELVESKVDVIVTHSTPGARAAKEATSTIPIVALGPSDPVQAGLVSSLRRPGGNLTGLTFFFADICAKRVELIKEALPRAKLIAVLINPTNETFRMALVTMDRTAQAIGVEIIPVQAKVRDEIADAFAAAQRSRVQALVAIEEPILTSNAKLVAELAVQHKLPMVGFKAHTDAGALMGYAVDLRDLWFRAGSFVDKLLKGEPAAQMPIEQAVKFDLIVNLRSAKSLGIDIPPSLLVRATEVVT